MAYEKYLKKSAGKPSRRHVDFKDGDKGYELIGQLQEIGLTGEGIRAVIADCLEQVIPRIKKDLGA